MRKSRFTEEQIKHALGTRAPMAIPQDANLRWLLDFVTGTMVSARRFRI